MPPKAKKDKYSVLSGNAVIVYLYLLHYPDYAYNIAKTFDALSDKKKVKVPVGLARYSNVHALLQKLKDAELVKTEEIKNEKKNQPNKVLYTVDLEKIMGKHLFPEISIDPSLYISFVTLIAGNKLILKRILSFKKYDYLTVLLYMRFIFSLSLGRLVEFYAKTEHNELYMNTISKNFGKGWKEQEIQKGIDVIGDMIRQASPAGNNDKETFKKVLWHIMEYNRIYIAKIDTLCIAESAKERGFHVPYELRQKPVR